ncbi:MAG: ABC transporter permease, partial [Proteobacteria bacterium SW_6_67_9]
MSYADSALPSPWRRNWVALSTIVRKEITRFARIWVQTILPSAITTGLYLLIFGNLIGERIGPMEGYSYMDYIVPGIIMLSNVAEIAWGDITYS